MHRDWIQAIGSILTAANRNRFAEQIKELQEFYDLPDSDYDKMNIILTNIFKKEIDIDKAILFKYWIFDSDEIRIPISGGQVSLKLKMAIVNIRIPDGRICFINVRYTADSYSNTIYIHRADAHINIS